jgi:hypothetical protein
MGGEWAEMRFGSAECMLFILQSEPTAQYGKALAGSRILGFLPLLRSLICCVNGLDQYLLGSNRSLT